MVISLKEDLVPFLIVKDILLQSLFTWFYKVVNNVSFLDFNDNLGSASHYFPLLLSTFFALFLFSGYT